MPLIPLTALTMVAFAANSILNRLALADGSIGAVEFAALRVVSGALVLCLLVAVGSGWAALRLGDVQARLIPVGALSLYMFAFSLSYVVLEAGVGALILFGGVQVTMFAAAVIAREPVPLWRWVGSALALCGLAWILWPSGAAAPPLFWSGLMAAAAFGWGIYSLWGRSAGPPLPATAANFALAVPIAVALFALLVGPAFVISPTGAVLAVLSGAVTSGLGYALWYSVLPRLDSSTAALTQLSVPVIAMAGGMIFLGEALTWRFVGATILVLGGIALGILAPQRTMGSRGS